MPGPFDFPTDFRVIKALENELKPAKGRMTDPVDQSKMRVKVKMRPRPQPEIKTVPMPSPLSTVKTLGGIVTNAPQGAYDLATTLGPMAVDYFRRSSPKKVLADAKSGLGSYANYWRENPGEAAVGLVPLLGDAVSFGEMTREAALARDAGDEELARTIEGYTLPVFAAGLIPEVGGAVGSVARKTTRAVKRARGGLAVKRKKK